jgi:hypothetical protein
MAYQTVEMMIIERDAVPPPPPPEVVAIDERDRFLTVIATQLNEALLAPPLPGEPDGFRESLRPRVIATFIDNFERSTAAYRPLERVIALQAASEIVLAGVDAEIKDMYMTRIAMIDINAPVIQPVVEPSISTAELETMARHETDAAVSPPRGTTIRKIQAGLQAATSLLFAHAK